jgi:hypothetical protein
MKKGEGRWNGVKEPSRRVQERDRGSMGSMVREGEENESGYACLYAGRCLKKWASRFKKDDSINLLIVVGRKPEFE